MNKNTQDENKSQFSLLEEEVLDFWRKGDTFKKSVEKEAPQGDYVFYDGPPFITGLPHYATLLPSIAKDVIPRYFTMKGHRVERVWGWDCHGIPAENRVEKNLGLKNKKDIEDLGVEKFVGACRDYVSTSSEQWEWYIERIGRWVDMKNSYKTMDLKFMESVMWAFKELYKKDLIYEGYRTSLHCPRCATPLSKFEITMDAGSYRDVQDDSVVVKFKTEDDFYLLAWTTTPWTLPGNLALAVRKDLDYVLVESEGEKYVVAKERVKDVFKENSFKTIKKIKGKDLLGKSYEPVFDLENKEIKENKKTFKVYEADFVSTQEGTGVVHVAPNFGEDDFELGKKESLPMIELMNESGVYTKNAGEWKGFYFQDANEKAKEDLGEKIFLKEKSVHSYPFCYRCDTRLMHKTQKAWYLKINEIRDKMIKENKDINWVPEYFKEGRFQYNLENAPDWCLSRSRYWGSPIPVWKCDCGSVKVIGSLEELEKESGVKVEDLHRPRIDEVVLQCKECNKKMKRVKEVLDCWFESGSMPFAQFHYPFERKNEWKNLFPADFIIEYTGQLRGWFYYLHVLSCALFNSLAFRNVIVTGVLAGTDGRKMSKSLGNYPDPKIVLEKYGSDALRVYFMSSSIMVGGDMELSEIEIQDALRKNVILLSNVLRFYEMFAKEKNYVTDEKKIKEPKVENVLDKWILQRLNQALTEIESGLQDYTLPSSCEAMTNFIDDLSTWYIRRSRNRFKGEDENDAKKALETTGFVLHQFSKAIAPIMPFLAERVWQSVTGNEFQNEDESVHLKDYPKYSKVHNEELLSDMEKVRYFVSLALKARADAEIKIRQPLSSLVISKEGEDLKNKKELLNLVKEEVNVKEVSFEEELAKGVFLDKKITEELKEEGVLREVIRTVQSLRKKANLIPNDKINLLYESDNLESILKKKEDVLKKEVGAQKITKGRKEETLAEKELQIDGSNFYLGITMSLEK
jgi:isoleucyl-tRNA synthetase